ncbi:hypothetical protein PPL_11361 [Heterostelium album PN500]|uniref:Uncharacterized protein n=1 Tax=Heterostelium pallidum (strain ATCC 26659 / Pp 5 / PN500) TaxID=670386 RepID=D3BT68_HETP5|nr:hypothetical protein PPL_11361 [Heterostelium album PN500]EFA75285.1 hypothetical protein PPL_11361 [Heterostelium album PN500]|eukprot:XP_020427419.1 hypothetical protein PPL_11361 [Heterostelium album PN500]
MHSQHINYELLLKSINSSAFKNDVVDQKHNSNHKGFITYVAARNEAEARYSNQQCRCIPECQPNIYVRQPVTEKDIRCQLLWSSRSHPAVLTATSKRSCQSDIEYLFGLGIVDAPGFVKTPMNNFTGELEPEVAGNIIYEAAIKENGTGRFLGSSFTTYPWLSN